MKQCYLIVRSVEKIQKVKTQKLQGQKTKNNLSSKCPVCDSKKSKFIKKEETEGLF